MPTKKAYASRVRVAMENLGTFKPEFEPVINIYAGLMREYEVLWNQYSKSKFAYEVPTADGAKKAPIVTTLESLRKDILTYSAQLGLTVQGLLKLDDKAFAKKKVSQIEILMSGDDG